MERAAAMAQGASERGAMMVFDTGSTPEGAAQAAAAARKAGAALILGPVFSRDVRSVLAAVGGAVPVVTFSNDAGLLESGAFLFGITAQQVAASIVGYAARRGVRRVAVGGPVEGWGSQVRSAVAVAATSLGIDSYQLPPGDSIQVPSLAAGGGDGLADAVLLPTAADALRMAPMLAAQGVQLLGAFQGLDLTPDALAALDGAWLAAPDPERFSRFARAYETRNGTRPGLIAGLAYDAAGIAAQMRRGGGVDRSALLVGEGFSAVCGDVRFREDGSATRALAVLAVANGGLRAVAVPPAR